MNKHLLPLDRITVLISEWQDENPTRLQYQEENPRLVIQWRDLAEERLLNVSDEEEVTTILDHLADELEEQHTNVAQEAL